MPAFEWQWRHSRSLGATLVPFVQVSFRSAAGTFRLFSLQVDTGAVISLLPRSHAEILGLDQESGRRLELGAVGGSTTTCFIHELSARIGDLPALTIPVAFAVHDGVPLLFGRAGIMDKFRMTLDPHTRSTSVELA